ncbi:MAG: FAD-linked oxidase C-terminal domain-containing protein [Gemmatimonadales bacterium]
MRRSLIRELERIVGARWVKWRPTETVAYRADGLPTHETTPGCIVLPGTRQEAVAVLQLLHTAQVPFVARGAGTGLSGGALAQGDAALLTLTRLNRVLHIDPATRRAVVEPGVINTRLSEAAAPHGLYFAPDPSSQTACTLGGNVAENAGGPHCLKYGVTTNHIVALEVCLSDGTMTSLGSRQGESWGPDLVGLFVGSEGMFGVALEITVRLEPLPQSVVTLLADFMALRDAGEAVTAIIASGVVPAALEMMDQPCVQAVEDSIYAAGYPRDAEAVLLVEVDGTPAAVKEEAEIVTQLLRRHGARQVQSASDPDRRARLWQGRKKAFGALGRIAPDLAVQDAVVPRSALPDILDRIAGIKRHYRLNISNVFHAGDGNLHPNISFDRRDAELTERVRAASAEIMAVCLDAGGSITGEHGVGSDKIGYMAWAFSADSLATMQAVRQAFDPDERANPGKVIPVHACREWRAGGVP